MQFNLTWDLVIERKKTQTRREWRVEWCELKDDRGNIKAVYQNGRRKYYIGQTLSVQPGRGKKGVARIKILNMWREDINFISSQDAEAEGITHLFPLANEFDGHHLHNAFVRTLFRRLWHELRRKTDDALVIEFELVDA